LTKLRFTSDRTVPKLRTALWTRFTALYGAWFLSRTGDTAVPILTSRPLRFIRVRDYLIAYAPDEKPLWVIAVMHGHRSPRGMAAILRGREER
jgi:hypothetical protein